MADQWSVILQACQKLWTICNEHMKNVWKCVLLSYKHFRRTASFIYPDFKSVIWIRFKLAPPMILWRLFLIYSIGIEKSIVNIECGNPIWITQKSISKQFWCDLFRPCWRGFCYLQSTLKFPIDFVWILVKNVFNHQNEIKLLFLNIDFAVIFSN